MKTIFLALSFQVIVVIGCFAQSLQLDKKYYKPGEDIQVRFTASSSYSSNAWIGIIPSNVTHGSEAENDKHDISFQYINGLLSGTKTFVAPKNTGSYDFRMNDSDNNGHEVASVSFVVTNDVPDVTNSAAMTNIPSSSARLVLPRKNFSKGEQITVEFTAPAGLPETAWVGIVPSHIPHGSEDVNDQNDVSYQYLNKKRAGTLTFNAPDTDGNWDFRMNSADGGGKEIASISFSIGGTSATTSIENIAKPALQPAEGDVCFDNWNKMGVQNSPVAPTYFYLAKPTVITRITNYHWNNGSGVTPGVIGIRSASGQVMGSWNAIGTSGTGGATNVNWIVSPNIRLKPGVYEVIDSDKYTWSYNSGSFGCGFCNVIGK